MQVSSSFDVVVVGGGGSGLAAAVSAAQAGGRVVLLEKQPCLGGTTGIAVGSFTASGTRLQRQAGISDQPADHAADAAKFAAPEIEARNNGPLRQYLLAEAGKTLSWLEALGLAFYGPNPEPPNRVPRMHNVVPNAKAYVAALELELRRLGGEIVCNAAVTGLIREQGRVVGVSAEVSGTPCEFRATRGVILAAGDYANAPDLIGQHKGPGFDAVEGINPFATGDGQRLVAAAGGQLVNMDVTYGPELRFISPVRSGFQSWLPTSRWTGQLLAATARRLPAWILRAYIKRLLVTWQHPESALFDDGAILVNQQGDRFVNERTWPDRELAVARQPGKVAFIVLDCRLIQRYSAWPHFISTAPDIAYAYVNDYLRLRADVAVAAGSLEELAMRRGLDANHLAAAIEGFNRYVAGEGVDRFGRTGDRHDLSGGPWLLLGPAKAYFTTTEGGAAIDDQLRVLDTDGNVIPGLFAVGQTGLGGMILWGHGLHIAWAMTSGRLAGANVMQGNEVICRGGLTEHA